MRKKTLARNMLRVCAWISIASVHAQAPDLTSAQVASESSNAAFVQQAAHVGLAEVELGRLAIGSASSAAVRTFAQKMIDDYTRANQDLAVIAVRENIVMPRDLDSEHAQLRERLAGLHGADFDRAYVNAMRDDQQKILDLLKSSGALVSADQLRTFIKQTLPMVQEHLLMARDLDVQ